MGDCLKLDTQIVNVRRFRILDFKIPPVTGVTFSQEHLHTHTAWILYSHECSKEIG